MTRKLYVLSGATFLMAAAFVGYGVGVSVDEKPEPEVVTKTVVKEKVVTETETVEVVDFPDSCLSANKYARFLAEDAFKLSSASAPMLENISQSRIAMADKDQARLLKAETAQRELDSETLDLLFSAKDYFERYERAQDSCDADLD